MSTVPDTRSEATLSTADSSDHAEEVKERAVSGAKIMGLRTVISIALRVISSIVLSRILDEKDYGAFNIAAYLSSFGTFIADLGLAGALVQKKNSPSEREYGSVFVSQQILMVLFIGVMLAMTPLLRQWYQLDDRGMQVVWAMVIAMPLFSLRVTPLIRLERNLQFHEIARIELWENIIRVVATIAMAFAGWEVWALAVGQIIGMAVFATLLWLAAHWKPVLVCDTKEVFPLLKFGLPYQVNAFLPTLMHGPVIASITQKFGDSIFGYFSWAMGLASIPLMLNAVLMRVAFPAYSRLQNDPEALGRYVKASTRRLGSILWTIIALLIIVLPVGIPLVYGDKWIPAANLLQWLVADAVLQAMICNIASVQNATGRPIERVWITLGIGLFRWGMVVFVAPTFGLVWLGLLISFVPNFIELSITAFMVERRNAGCRGLYREILTPLFCTGVVLGVAFWAGSLLAPASAWLQIGIALGVFVVLSAAREYLTPLRIIRPEIPALLALLRRKSS